MKWNLILFLILKIVFIESLPQTGSYGLPARLPILMINGQERTKLFSTFSGKASFLKWNCRFEEDFCNLKNSYHLAQFQRYSNPRSPMFDETSMLYINVTNAADMPAARLESDYLAAEHRQACLSLRYLLYGTGARKLFVIQQDIENKCIWADHNDSVDNYGQWRDTQMTIDMRDGNPRFFIEAHIDGRHPNYGTIAISALTVSYGVCNNDKTNKCQRIDNQSIPSVPTPAK